jgi:hypothetical protein
MIRKIFLGAVPFIFLISLSACDLMGAPAAPTQDTAAFIQTQVVLLVASTAQVQTDIANSVVQTLAAMQTNTPESTFTPTFTITPAFPMVGVTVETNCRSGPGTAYEALGIVFVGDTAQVVGRNSTSEYWIIKLPSNHATTCWLWGKYATVVGNTSGLPVSTPPPTPSPAPSPTTAVSFAADFTSVTLCPATWVSVTFKITNTGKVTWESIQTKVVDNVSHSSGQNDDDDVFTRVTACDSGPASQNLAPGEVGYSSAILVPPSPAGHSVTASFRVCSEDDMSGVCKEKSFTFTP